MRGWMHQPGAWKPDYVPPLGLSGQPAIGLVFCGASGKGSRTPMNSSLRIILVVSLFASLAGVALAAADRPTLQIATPMPAPEWARLERRLLAESVPACREFAEKYYDDRGHFRVFARWGANDGPDDAFENFADWPQLHALGASDEIIQIFLKTWNGMISQYTEAKTVDVPIARQGMYYKDFCVQTDWMHHGEAMRTFNMMGLSVPTLPIYQTRARRFAGFYMAEDPEAPNYDPKLKLIRSMQNGSRGPMLRKATALDWVGDPFDVAKYIAGHGENTFAQFLQHYEEYGDVVGDHFLNLVATALPLNAYLLSNEPKYKQWLVEYMDAWLARMKQNGGIIPSYVALDGKIGGPEGKWWNNAYGWGFSPVNPVNGRRENRKKDWKIGAFPREYKLRECLHLWWGPWSSKPVEGLNKALSGFDSHTLPLRIVVPSRTECYMLMT